MPIFSLPSLSRYVPMVPLQGKWGYLQRGALAAGIVGTISMIVSVIFKEKLLFACSFLLTGMSLVSFFAIRQLHATKQRVAAEKKTEIELKVSVEKFIKDLTSLSASVKAIHEVDKELAENFRATLAKLDSSKIGDALPVLLRLVKTAVKRVSQNPIVT